MKKILFALILLPLLTGCALNQQTKTVTDDTASVKFAVYLADSNEMIFSEDDITSYEPSSKTFTFTPEGAEKMKSYQPSLQLDTGLYKKSFVAKLGDEEIYKGKFWSNASSSSESGIVMTDVLFVGPDFNTLTVAGGYPTAEFGPDSDEKINNPVLIEHFKSINKIK